MPLAESTLLTALLVLARVGGWLMFDPLTRRLPRSLRLILAAALAAALTPSVLQTAAPPLGLGVPLLLVLALECVWGAALALCVWLIFAAVEAVLVWTGHTATGGLLMLTDEQAYAADAPWRTLAGWLAAMAFLAADGHLLVVNALRESFIAMPLATWPAEAGLRQLAESASWLFAVGVQLALPLLALALLIQLALALVARTVPGLDFFAAGLTLASLGLLAAWIAVVPLVTLGVQAGLDQLLRWWSLL
jgi:flagellar biosynthetic protein FliR